MSIEEDEQFETFIPYNQNREYFFVRFIEYIRCAETNDLETLVVNYSGSEFELKWDNYDSHYRGRIIDPKLGTIHGFVA